MSQALALDSQNNILPIAGSGVVPAGAILPFAGPDAPSGWAICDGSAVSREDNAALFGVIGTRYGAGDGLTTFNLPDYRGEFLRGQDRGAGRDPDVSFRSDSGGGFTDDEVGSKQTDQAGPHGHAYSGTTGSDGHSHTFTTSSDGHYHHGMRAVNSTSPKLEFGTNEYGAASSTSSLAYSIRRTTSTPNTLRTSTDTHNHTGSTNTDTHSHSYSGVTDSAPGAESRPNNVYVNFIIKVA